MYTTMSPILRILIILFIWKAAMCEKLISLNKGIRSSSTHTAVDQNWDPRHAVDGNLTDTPNTCKCCAATGKEGSPWFELDLGREFLIERIDVVGRSKSEAEDHNLGRMEIFLAPEKDIQRKAALTKVTRTLHSFNFSLPSATPSRFVTLILQNTVNYFVICELSVYGDCVDGEFGPDCGYSCHCEGNHCNKTTGICPSGKCLPGFTERRCNRECKNGMYGFECKHTCGSCFNNAPCDNVKGTCDKCADGYMGTKCDSTCEKGRYSSNCTETCGKCKDNAVCNFTDGSCPAGCELGYTDKTCKIPCNRGKYGADCQESCGHCKNKETCNRVDGTCPNKCEAGYTGDMCKTECTRGRYGEECVFECGVCRDNLQCNITTGACDDGCNPGFTNIYCNKTCLDGQYGIGCNESCGLCREGEACRKTDGHCVKGCPRGKQPPLCQTDCNVGTYGEDCQSKCGHCINGSACDVFFGNCSECDEGYYGVKCLPVQSESSISDVIAPIVASILSLVFLVAIVIIAVIIWIKVKRRRAQNPEREQPTSTPNGVGTISTLNRAEERQYTRVQSVRYENMGTLTINQNAVKPVTETKSTKRGDQEEENFDTECTEEKIGGVCVPVAGVGDDHEYYAFVAKETDIKIHQLWDYIVDRKKQENNGFHQEFSQLPQGLHHPHQVAMVEENRPKNRYRGLYAYDHTRVPLKAEKGESEYINACFVNGYGEPKRFIASQGPTDEMRDDFWRMIWQQKSKQIVMLTNLVEMGNKKCLIYWPEEGEEIYGKIKVHLQSEETFGDFIIRNLKVQKGTETPVVMTQYHFKAWPDKDVPDTTWSLVKFWRTVAKDRSTIQKDGPIIVHCSAGIGRTGTFIALDNAYTQAKLEGTVRVQSIVRSLREQRVDMVQTLQQYVYVHEALADAFMFGTHAICMNQFHDVYAFLKEIEKETKNPRLRAQYDLLVKSIEDRYQGEGKMMIDKTSSETLAGAVFLPNSQDQDVFIAMKTPKENGITEFWSVVQEQKVKTIVSLGAKEKADTKKNCFHLESKLQETFSLTLVEENDASHYIERKLTYKSQTKEELTVKQYECTKWTSNSREPIEPRAFIDLLENVLHWQQDLSDTHPVLVHCPSGAKFSGVVCILLNELNRMKQDGGVLNVLQSVKTMKARNHDFISTYEEYLFVFEVIRCYLEGGDVYANV